MILSSQRMLEKEIRSGIKELLEPFSYHMEKFNRVLRKELESPVPLVDRIAEYIVRRKGKQFRPLLVILSGLACGTEDENLYRAAAVVELIHTATLVHDDVVDESYARRGFPAIQMIWKNKVAVLMGDYLLSKSLIIASETGNLELMHLIASVAREMSQGELLQIEKSRKLNINKDEYFKMISYKTASLISASCEVGALIAGSPPDVREGLREYGKLMGMAFQIKDDLLDYEGDQQLLGKPIINDLQDKKITLPLLYAFDELSEVDVKKIKKMIKKGIKNGDVDYILNLVKNTGGLEKARAHARDLIDQAVAKLESLPSSLPKTTLEKIAYYVVERNK